MPTPIDPIESAVRDLLARWEAFVLCPCEEGETTPLEHFFRWAGRRGISRPDARDAVQDIFLMVLERIRDGVADDEILNPAWLATCARREAVQNHVRSGKVVPAARDRVPTAWDARGREVHQDLLEAAGRVLAGLTGRVRELIELSVLAERTLAEIADQVDKHAGTVCRWLMEIRERLAEEIVEDLVRQGYDRGELPDPRKL